jgi:hypothetical protein
MGLASWETEAGPLLGAVFGGSISSEGESMAHLKDDEQAGVCPNPYYH